MYNSHEEQNWTLEGGSKWYLKDSFQLSSSWLEGVFLRALGGSIIFWLDVFARKPNNITHRLLTHKKSKLKNLLHQKKKEMNQAQRNVSSSLVRHFLAEIGIRVKNIRLDVRIFTKRITVVWTPIINLKNEWRDILHKKKMNQAQNDSFPHWGGVSLPKLGVKNIRLGRFLHENLIRTHQFLT